MSKQDSSNYASSPRHDYTSDYETKFSDLGFHSLDEKRAPDMMEDVDPDIIPCQYGKHLFLNFLYILGTFCCFCINIYIYT